MDGIGWNMNEICWNIDGTFGIQGPYETSKDYVRISMKSKATSMEYVGMTMSMLKR